MPAPHNIVCNVNQSGVNDREKEKKMKPILIVVT